jgi:hyperosmotically inducible periplasmic protein
MIRSISVVVLTLMLMTSSWAQAPASVSSDNSALASQVQRSLRSTQIANADAIKVEAKGDSVQLSGFVESERDQAKALETARAVRGVASVRNDLVVRESRPTVGQALDDTIIAAQVRQQIESKVANAAGDINVSVSDGVVQLSGYVVDANEKNQAADVASAVQGVQDVRNDIALKQ